MKRPPNLSTARRVRKIKMLVLDVDGVLTDGRIVMDDRGRETKFFDVRDGHGLKMLMRTGIEVVFLTGRKSRVVEQRARELGVTEVYQGALNKAEVFEALLERAGLKASEAAYAGDDIVDVPVMRKAGFSVAVLDAVAEARKAAHYVTKKKGGRGAVREVCEVILKGQGKWADIRRRYGSL
ncbi:MAG TPA: HAD-IIIA family hydrolase [Syntrophales bacterium]|nr:HAD-IIIA family hydrolase [Syntrophales bacterium]HOX94485.1 HAD-IIIA family hydrolase [Syntrophales bacterium]HPI55837.1 HAD-IIIA family hydrolase [Syntrophales bacterium]HPN23672.1 HAD-IIIA family hydrolase [Syntrophales bacterium]HQM27803.1 HAD-IIIA family hydrolase [Syntrophales bacterium]